MEGKRIDIFLSYCWADDQIANNIYSYHRRNKLNILL